MTVTLSKVVLLGEATGRTEKNKAKEKRTKPKKRKTLGKVTGKCSRRGGYCAVLLAVAQRSKGAEKKRITEERQAGD